MEDACRTKSVTIAETRGDRAAHCGSEKCSSTISSIPCGFWAGPHRHEVSLVVLSTTAALMQYTTPSAKEGCSWWRWSSSGITNWTDCTHRSRHAFGGPNHGDVPTPSYGAAGAALPLQQTSRTPPGVSASTTYEANHWTDSSDGVKISLSKVFHLAYTDQDSFDLPNLYRNLTQV